MRYAPLARAKDRSPVPQPCLAPTIQPDSTTATLSAVPQPRRRVLILGLNYPPERTGISPYTGAVARGLTARGLDISVLTAHPHYPAWKVAPGYGGWTRHEVIDGVRLRRLRHYVPQHPTGTRRVLSELTFGARLVLTSWSTPDAIIAVSPALFSTASAMVRWALCGHAVPFIVWVQDLYGLGLGETGQGGKSARRLVTAAERCVLRHATRVVVAHERFATRIEHDFEIPAARIGLVRNWVHTTSQRDDDRALRRASLGWQPEEFIVLHAGNMGVKQGLDNVLGAAREADQCGAKVRFVLLGDGSERRRLVAAAAGIQRITFLDPLDDDDFVATLRAADVLLVNEKQGVAEMAVPSKLTSYFSAGRPVLAAAAGDGITAEEIRLSGAGIVIPPGDPRALLGAALSLAKGPSSADRLGRNGVHFCDAVLSESVALDKFEELINTLVAGQPNVAAASTFD